MNTIISIFNGDKDAKVNLFFMVLFVVLVVMMYYSIDEYFVTNLNTLNNVNTRWSRNQCSYVLSDTLADELNASGLSESQNNWNLFFPCAYDDIKKEVHEMPVVNGAKYFVLENCDEIVAKELLWKNVVNYYDYNIAKTMMPNSYILYEKADLNRFNDEFDLSKIYIMKKNIQRQEGLKITKNKEEILKGYETDGYVVVQELLQNPYIISGRKTNMRFYVLVVCRGDDMNVYVYKDGFMYYTKDLFKLASTEEGPNITTGYIDRQVYIDNPLTHEDLIKYLDDQYRPLLDIEKKVRDQGLKVSQVYFNKIYHLIRQTFIAFQGKLTNTNGVRKFNNTNITFQLFGVDIAVDDKLNPMIIEVNKGPDLGAKDERDSALKHGVVRNILKIIGATPMNNCNETKFLKVLDITNGTIGLDNHSNCSL